MPKQLLCLLAILTIVSSCATKNYNTPFIDTEETVMLEFGMSKEHVRSLLNDPLYVESGNKNNVIWVYEVRTIEVESKKDTGDLLNLLNSKVAVIPRKIHHNTKHAKALHKLSLTFDSSGKLMSWNSN